MNPPKIPDYTLTELIGEGSTGSVWSASYQGQRTLAVKCLKGLAINRQLLSDALVKIYNAPAHPGIVAVRDFDLASPQAYIAMDLCAEKVQLADGRGIMRARNLDSLCGALSADESWRVAIDMADSLAFLHRKQIIHCNLKPSNVLFDEGDNARPMLADFAQGLLGGIEQIAPGDSLFHAAPEQLRDPDHFFEGRGEKWDVYSFGVTTYRLLTGTYPRLNSAIAELARRNANQLDLHLKVTPAQIAGALAGEPDITWPTEPAGTLEARRRTVIENCLQLDPAKRYVDMREVLDAFRAIEKELEHAAAITSLEEEKETLTLAGKRAGARAKLAGLTAIAAAGVAAFFLYDKLTGSGGGAPLLVDDAPAAAAPENDPVLLAERDARAAAEGALANAADNLRHTQGALDAIFAMIAARDGDGQPLYDIPEGTLGTVLNYYDEFVTRHRGDPEMGESLAGALHNSGQLQMMLGGDEAARQHFTDAANLLESLEAGGGEGGALLARRAAIYRDLSDAESASGLPLAAIASAIKAQQISSTLVERDPENPTTARGLAASSLRVARKVADAAKHGEAAPYIDRADSLLAELEASGQLNEDDLALLAASSFERGRMERALGQRETAVQAQIASIDRYLGLLEARPDVPAYRFQLARAYGEAADLAALLGEPDESLTANQEASELLRTLADSNADKPAYRHELAIRMRATAAHMRDSGKGDALAEQDKALVLLEDLHKTYPQNSTYAYDFAMVGGIQADLASEAKKDKEALALSQRSVILMQELLNEDLNLEDNNAKRPKYRKALANLYGKLGHYTQKLGNKEKALHCFEKSLKQYQNLAANNPDDKGSAAGVSWAARRITDLQ